MRGHKELQGLKVVQVLRDQQGLKVLLVLRVL
jgi:hypothetical protein